MVEKIIVQPENVRCLENIISPAKIVDDFECYNSLISSSTVSVNGLDTVVFGLQYQPVATVSLSLSSSTVTYGTAVTLTATVVDGDSEPIEDASISFRVNGTEKGAGTTNSSGVATYSYTTDTVGTLSVTAVYGSISSSTSTLTVNKITSTISLSAASSTVTYGSNVSLSGTLSVGSGKTVTIYQGGSSIGTVTTTTGGAFTKTVSGLDVGTYSFTAGYAGDDTHTSVTSSSVSVTVSQAVTPSSISLISNKSILSYADSESATLTATVLDSSSQGISGETVTMGVYKSSDDSLVETLAVTDVGDGTYTASYLGKGTGDLYIQAFVRTLQSESYSIEDCIKYIENGSKTFGNVHTISSLYDVGECRDLTIEAELSSTNNGYRLAYGKYSTDTSGWMDYIGVGCTGSGNAYMGKYEGTEQNIATGISLSSNTYYPFKIELKNGVFKGYVNNTQLSSSNVSLSSLRYVVLHSWTNSKTISYKDLKVKPL